MTKQAPWFFEERALAFAKLVLTEHDNVTIRAQSTNEMAINLLAETLKDGKSTLRFFGVNVVATMDLPSPTTISDLSSRIGSQAVIDATLPVCLFIVGVRKPEGIYRWLVKPLVEEGRALLEQEVTGEWQPLEEKAVQHLVEQVNAWYDALQSSFRAKTFVSRTA